MVVSGGIKGASEVEGKTDIGIPGRAGGRVRFDPSTVPAQSDSAWYGTDRMERPPPTPPTRSLN